MEMPCVDQFFGQAIKNLSISRGRLRADGTNETACVRSSLGRGPFRRRRIWATFCLYFCGLTARPRIMITAANKPGVAVHGGSGEGFASAVSRWEETRCFCAPGGSSLHRLRRLSATRRPRRARCAPEPFSCSGVSGGDAEHRGPRLRPGHRPGRPGQGLRFLLPGRRRARPPHRRHRPGPIDRQGSGHRPFGSDQRRKHARRRQRVPCDRAGEARRRGLGGGIATRATAAAA